MNGLIYVNSVEAANYSWHLNREKNKCARCILAIGAALKSFFLHYEIKIVDIEKFIRSNSKKNIESFFARSLDKRGFKIIKSLRVEIKEENEIIEVEERNLSANLKKYKNYFKIAVSGVKNCGKSTFINKMRDLKISDVDAIPIECSDIKLLEKKIKIGFYELNKSVVLCELPRYVSEEHLLEKNVCFDKFDAIIILHSHWGWVKEVKELAIIAKEANKPYLIIRNKIDLDVVNYNIDYGSNESEEFIIDKLHENTPRQFIRHNVPYKGKPFLISNYFTDKYDFKEVEQLISNANFSASVTQ